MVDYKHKDWMKLGLRLMRSSLPNVYSPLFHSLKENDSDHSDENWTKHSCPFVRLSLDAIVGCHAKTFTDVCRFMDHTLFSHQAAPGNCI